MRGSGRRGPTLEDVALAAGVSRATASRALAGYGMVAPDTSVRVRAVADRLGYTPDLAARALVGGGGFRLVVAVQGATAGVLEDPYVARLVGAAARVAAPQGVGVALEWLPLHAPERLAVLAADRSVRGVLLVNTTAALLEAVPDGLRRRVVSVGIGSAQVPAFDVDNAGGARALLRHMYAAGRRRIAMISGPAWLPCAGRPVTAYRRLMAEAGLPARVVPGDFTAESGRAAAGRLLDLWPDTDAVLAICDAAALGVLAELRARAVRVPDTVAVAGFDDIPLAALSSPGLTTASHPVDRIAAGAVAALLQDGAVPATTTWYPSEPVLRQSA